MERYMKKLKSCVLPLIFIFIAAAGLASSGDWEQLSDITENMNLIRQIQVSGAENIVPTPVKAAKRLVCIDPGHPSPFSGGDTVQHGTTEFHINWVVALKLQQVLKSKGVEVMMTKSVESQNIDNRVRAIMINEAAEEFLKNNPGGTAVTVHLHCDSSPQNGFTIYYPDQKGKYSGVSGDEPDIGTIGPDEKIQKTSKILADAVHAAMASKLKGKLKDLGVKGDSRTLVGSPGHQGALTFSIFSKIPTATIEMVVLNNPGDAKFIKTEAGQQLMAEAIAGGLLGK